MFPSMSSCARIKPKSNLSKNMAAVGHLWFFLLSHRLRNEWNLPIKLASMSSWILVKWWNLAFWFLASLSVRFNAYMYLCKYRKISNLAVWFPARTKWNFPLTGWLSHLLQDHWSDYFRYWSECSPQYLFVQEQKPKSNLSKNMAAVGHLWFFLLSHRLRIEWNLPIRLASMSSWILAEWWNLAVRFPASLFVTTGHHAVGGEGATPHSNPQTYILGGRTWKKWPFSHLWQIRLTFTFERIWHTCEEFARICHTCE